MKANLKSKPSPEEKHLAMVAQTTDKPLAIVKPGIFSALLKQSTTDAESLLGGEKTVWINTMDVINPLFPSGGNFSRPFFAIRAWFFESKTATQKARIGLKIALPDQKIYHVSLSYPISDVTGEPLYSDRQVILQHFEESSVPVGLMQFEKVDRGHSNTYWRLIYSDEHSMELAGEPAFINEEGAISAPSDEAPF